MKAFTLLFLLAIICYSCKKDQVSAQTLSLLQHKWTIVSDSINYPNSSANSYVIPGSANDYYEFFSNDSVHETFAAPAGARFDFTTSYHLSDNNTIILKGSENYPLTIVQLSSNALILSNAVTAESTGSPTYYGTRFVIMGR
jgi:hypothetical protein